VTLIAPTAELNRDSRQATAAEAQRLDALLRGLQSTLQVSSFGFDEWPLDLPITCAKICRRVSATYSVRSASTATSRDIWAVLSVQNRSSVGVYAGRRWKTNGH
jgi:hypothetical protein